MQDWKALSAELTHLKVWYDALTIERDQLEAARQTIGTGKAFLLRGWVPAEVAQQVADKCRSLASTCSVDITDPAEGDEPPFCWITTASMHPTRALSRALRSRRTAPLTRLR